MQPTIFPRIGQGLPAYRISIVNRYFEVGTINRINRLKPVNCSTKFTTVALIKSAPKEKIRRPKNSTVIDRESDSLSITVEFFSIAVFFRGALLYANSRYLPPPYSFAGGGYRSMQFWGLYI